MADLKTETVKKTLIFCFDGTCNDPGGVKNYAEDQSITNILKLHILFGGYLRDESKRQPDDGTIVTDDDSHQQSFYYKGVGTYGGKLRRFLNMALAPENADVKSILDAATEDLVEHYEKGDHVLVFGFERGAALARRFASVAREKSGKEGLKIDFLGVFDTVAAISSYSRGLGRDFSPETKPASDVVVENDVMSPNIMSPNIMKAVHLVALDENRIALQPTLFDHDPEGRITEVWFPGTNSDVGGGYWYDGLSDSALEYMIKKVEQKCAGHVRILDPEEIDYDQLNGEDGTQITKDDIDIKPSVKGALHKHKQKTKTTVTTIRIVVVKIAKVVGAVLASAVVGIATDGIAGKIVSQIVGQITGITVGIIVGGIIIDKTINKIGLNPREVKIAGSHPNDVHPMVHASVQHRYKEVMGYRPQALRDVKYYLTDDKQVNEVRQKV